MARDIGSLVRDVMMWRRAGETRLAVAELVLVFNRYHADSGRLSS